LLHIICSVSSFLLVHNQLSFDNRNSGLHNAISSSHLHGATAQPNETLHSQRTEWDINFPSVDVEKHLVDGVDVDANSMQAETPPPGTAFSRGLHAVHRSRSSLIATLELLLRVGSRLRCSTLPRIQLIQQLRYTFVTRVTRSQPFKTPEFG
jgi:hypothetical protein